jgi:hypothetical protein
MKPRDPCAICERFTTKDYPEQAAAGLGRCTGFDNPGTPISFVRHDAPPCVLFMRAKNRAQRERFVAGLQNKKETDTA